MPFRLLRQHYRHSGGDDVLAGTFEDDIEPWAALLQIHNLHDSLVVFDLVANLLMSPQNRGVRLAFLIGHNGPAELSTGSVLGVKSAALDLEITRALHRFSVGRRAV
ncbi:MAG: hypothetical protein U5N86_13435 [Planctomycetota bacterium]|nr:hypothetical protein [Planctomycetota bacterium]